MSDNKLSKEFLLTLYRRMVLIRRFEERVKFLFLEGAMPGTIHQCQGQEASAVGVCAALQPDDVITSTHRPHGHCIAKGLPVKDMMAELFGKTTGCCKGKGGSMHMGDITKGIIPAIAIVGGGVPLAAGAAMAFQMRSQKRVAVAFMGDGATNEGVVYETLNMASIWNLPVVFVVENNLYGASTPVAMVNRCGNLSEKAKIFCIPGVTVDGNDPLAVFEAAGEAIRRARNGEGPTLLELMTYRITGHSRRDPALYQPKDERDHAKAVEPIGRFGGYLTEQNGVSEEELRAIQSDVDREIEEALQFAQNSPLPKPEDALEDLFVEAL
ncbi:MAG: thiamine pyrophosphate-dependent dehydrogenase E1 component subunit alpha [Phycisphaerae bacterium]|nr:thiamine pyrophosphate-dependent dehydrogenase E1 component subunit alpha [Phycisphaerae bacterium]